MALTGNGFGVSGNRSGCRFEEREQQAGRLLHFAYFASFCAKSPNLFAA